MDMTKHHRASGEPWRQEFLYPIITASLPCYSLRRGNGLVQGVFDILSIMHRIVHSIQRFAR
jgi:hypothetical protein